VKHRISISPEVASEILSAEAFYDGVREGLGAEFEKEMEAILDSIAGNPNLYPKDFGEIRRALIRRFKMHVYYALRGDVILIVDIRDARREPPDWKDRGYTE
jgi:hypothetical protein